ncbi:dynein heavy chain [Pavlovales sp. CCMP2436]|nr:dynein heavy chain [Pavlovales sp. CCMP2436]
MAASLKLLEGRRAAMAELAVVFELSDAMLQADATVHNCRQDLAAVRALWAFSSHSGQTIESWRETLWSQVDIGRIESEAKLFLKSLRALDARARDFAVYADVERGIKELLVALPCAGDLRSPSMKERHWAQLAQITGVKLELTGSFKLADLLKLNLHLCIEDVGEVVERADKEEKMEHGLRKLAAVWEVVDFEAEAHDPTGVSFVRLSEENLECLDENQLLVRTMLASKYLDTFEAEVAEWHRKLTDVAEVHALLLGMLRRWASLHSLFVASADVQVELPHDAAQFAEIDAELRKHLEHLCKPGNVVSKCATEGLRPALASGSFGLERCEKSLADYMEAKRRVFPRFYFVSTETLLEILSHGSQPELVLAHVQAIMRAVSSVQLRATAEGAEGAERAEGAVEVVSLSSEGESLKFGAAEATLRLEGRVEVYLGDLLECTRAELRAQLAAALDELPRQRQNELLFKHVAQVVLLAAQLTWTARTEEAIARISAGSAAALAEYCARQRVDMAELIALVQGELSRNERQKIIALITLETHSRDVNARMLADGVRSAADFVWASQLKTRRQPSPDGGGSEEVVVSVCDAELRYSYEYLGNAQRLVVTPLTDRIYITATQACHLHLGCAPAGPAGTGKTETAKDLAAQLGRAIYVFNCGPEVDYRTIGTIFNGIATAGAWVCFDEFNRLLAEVLSVCSIQYKCVLDAQRAKAETYAMDGVTHKLSSYGCMAFVTMNPGYLGRTELPESLKVLFRPVTVMVPDMQMIIGNNLMAHGYTDALPLAKKFFTLYQLLGDLLSKQLHYDWGLRAIKSVLLVAGGFKRAEPTQTEIGLLMRALRDFNLPKLVEDDVVIFKGLLKDLFRDVYDSMPSKRDQDFESAVRRIVSESNLQPSDSFIEHVVDLQALLDTRHCVFCLATSGCNKTAAWQTLAKVWSRDGGRGATSWQDINPKAVTTSELYGYVNMATREWKDGLLSSTMRAMAAMPDTNPKWIILDGDLDANWIENMNSVMDDNRLLTLASNERIQLLSHMRLIFEIRDLNFATPATVTRAGILYIAEAGQWESFVASWVDEGKRHDTEVGKLSSAAAEARAEKLLALFEFYCKPTLAELRKNFKHAVPVLDFAMVQSLCHMLEGLLTVEAMGKTDNVAKFEIYFVYAAVWAFGGTLSSAGGLDYRKVFSKWWREAFKEVKYPLRGEVFDFYVAPDRHEFKSWTDVVPTLSYDPAAMSVASVTVPTDETVSASFWLGRLVANQHPAMLVGFAGCGKTAIVNGLLRSLDPQAYTTTTVNVNYFTNAALFQRVIEAPLEKKGGGNYGPPGAMKLVYFVDDLNMAALDKYNTASNISLLRQHLGYGHVYDTAKLTQKVLLDTQYLAAMNPTAGSFVVNPRLQRLFATFAVGFPSAEALTTIFSTFMLTHVRELVPHMLEVAKKIVQAALQLHKRVASTFRKTASKSHYEFNIRHIAGVVQGFLMTRGEELSDPLGMVQLWLHESERVYGDRLVDLHDLRRYKDIALEQLRRHFKDFSPTLAFAEPLVFCHFARGVGEPRYAKVASFASLAKVLETSLEEYNETNAAMNLVLFEDAMRHICRISRIIESPAGHALLVGVGGSGKQSLTRLAAFVSGFSLAQLVISATYGVSELKRDLQAMYRRCGVRGESTLFLLTDQQIADERFLVYINDLLSSGEIPGLFPPEDVDEIVAQMRPLMKRERRFEGKADCWAAFLARVRAKLHVALSFSPVGEAMATRTRRFPALINCAVIDWFMPWPEEALVSVSKSFLAEVDLGTAQQHASVCAFMPFAFIEVDALSKRYLEQERRYNWTTPKSFLELISLFTSMLAQRRARGDAQILRYQTGVHKLATTAESVSVLEQQLQSKQQQVEEKRAQCDALVPRMAEQKDRAAEESRAAARVADETAGKEAAVLTMKAKIDADLEAAEPALQQAAAALDSLNKKELSELRGLGKPPSGVDDVTAAVLLMLGDGTKKNVDTSWKATQALMRDLNTFMADLAAFRARIDEGDVPKSNFCSIRPLLEKEHFNVDAMRLKSVAAAGLCEWVLSIVEYWDINESIEPMRAGARQAEMDLSDAIDAKNGATRSAEMAEAASNETTEAYEAALLDKDAVVAEGELCVRKLALAQRLMASLGSEGDRWRSAIVTLSIDHDRLVGDVLLSAAFLSYAGCFNRRFRAALIGDSFLPFLQGPKRDLQMSEAADPLSILTDEAQVASWSNENLPADRVSIENGAIVTNCARWPLMIDPQLQGITWIKRREEAHGLVAIRLDAANMLRAMEEGMTGGNPVLLESMGESVDAIILPLLARQTVRRGRQNFVKLGDREVALEPSFRLYLQTKLSNPHYPPEIQAECTLINFMVTEEGLEDQLLALTVSKERPDLEEQRLVLIGEQNGYKMKVSELEDGILAQLANAEGDVLESLTLIENLEASKRLVLSIAEKAATSRATELSINGARETYRHVAARGALLFFLLSELPMLHSFHHYSLNAFLLVYEKAITGQKRSFKLGVSSLLTQIMPSALQQQPRSGLWGKVDKKVVTPKLSPEQLEKCVKVLVSKITFSVFNFARRGLFESHKLVVAAQLMFKVMRAEGELSEAEYEALVVGQRSPDTRRPPSGGHLSIGEGKMPDNLSEAQWAAALALRELESFRNLADDLVGAETSWNNWLAHATPERLDPHPNWAQLTQMQRLLLLRALRPDRVMAGLRAMVVDRLGEHFVVEEPTALLDVFGDSTASTPLLFILFPGVDPGGAIEKLGAVVGFTAANGRYISISMGQGQEAHAEHALLRFAEEGGWVFLQNVHLMQRWLPKLEKLLEVCAETGHSDFRCFLSAEPPLDPRARTMPESILQSAIKIANQPPTDIKANMRVALATFGEALFKEAPKPELFKPVLFALAFFHAAVLGRRRFGSLGFSRSYPFSTGDFTVCAGVLRSYMELRDSVPWSDLRCIVGDIMYGGHVTDAWDRRCISAYLETLLSPRLLEQKSEFALAPGLKSFSQGTFADARAHVNDKVPAESPILFGLHPNAELAQLIAQADEVFYSILELSGAGGPTGDSGRRVVSTKETMVLQVLTELQVKLPNPRSVGEIKAKVVDRGSPYTVFLLQEIERLNALLAELKRNLAELEQGLSGMLNISDEMDALFTNLFTNAVPPSWLQACGQSGPTGSYNCKSLMAWFADILLRDKQLLEWAKDPNKILPSVWISGLFNPMGYVTACLQVTARTRLLPLDSMTIMAKCMPFSHEHLTEQPEEGAYCHGLFIEGARWDAESASIQPSRPKELHSPMPVVHLTAITAQASEQQSVGRYRCPVYTTKVRGPTYQFTAILPSAMPTTTLVLAGVCLLLQAPS